ncbi:MAG: alkaline phosphatase family protein [Acidobacteria bacterium]|nr:alkaline phosphatase family protein [Acidobacteriota bacterium]
MEIPSLRGLMACGAWARGVIGVYPSVTYPSHTTLITRVLPRVHGIPSNGVFDPLARENNAYYRFADAIRVPTLISAAANHGLTTASVSWPVSVGMDWTWGVPEIWPEGTGAVANLLTPSSWSPGGQPAYNDTVVEVVASPKPERNNLGSEDSVELGSGPVGIHSTFGSNSKLEAAKRVEMTTPSLDSRTASLSDGSPEEEGRQLNV